MKAHHSLSLMLPLLLFLQLSAAINEQKTSLLFANNSHHLDDEALAAIKQATALILNNQVSDYEIYISAHTDNVGTANYNIDLVYNQGLITQILPERNSHLALVKHPSNEPITVLSIKIQDGKPLYATKRITTSRKPTDIKLEYQPGSMDDIKNAIKAAVAV